VERVQSTGSSFALRARSTTGNLQQRIVQAVSLCPGTTYRVSFQARRITSTGSVTAVAYINEVAVAGGLVTSPSFTSVPIINGGVFSLTSRNTAVLRIEVTYSGTTTAAKEVFIDNVAITPVS
jgi:hypothetical protein